jgi:hypothetical protein
MNRAVETNPVLPVVHLSPELADRVVSGALDGVSFDPACFGPKPLSILRCRPLPQSVVIYATGLGECPGMAMVEDFSADGAGRVTSYRFRDGRRFAEPYRLTMRGPGRRSSAPVQVASQAIRTWADLVGFIDAGSERVA